MTNSIVIVGPGRLGRSVAQILQENGHTHRLIGRGEAIPSSELTWLTVPDREIEAAAQAVPLGGIVLHASGARTTEALRPHTPAGSLHPLMTFPGPELGLPEAAVIPAAIAGDPDALRAAQGLAEMLGFSAFEVPGDRALYHAAAVTSGNFASVLMLEAGRMLTAAGVPEDQALPLLAPLAIASIKNAAAHGSSALTGPIARGDEQVIASHAVALYKLDPDLAKLYRALTLATRSIKR
jgi:predicted short-subunit dehydrogenase-like oxidoreductase (DUF2520 family)